MEEAGAVSDFVLFERHRDENFSNALLAFALRNSDEFAAEFVGVVMAEVGQPQPDDLKVIGVTRDPNITVTAGSRRPDLLLELETNTIRWDVLVGYCQELWIA